MSIAMHTTEIIVMAGQLQESIGQIVGLSGGIVELSGGIVEAVIMIIILACHTSVVAFAIRVFATAIKDGENVGAHTLSQ